MYANFVQRFMNSTRNTATSVLNTTNKDMMEEKQFK